MNFDLILDLGIAYALSLLQKKIPNNPGEKGKYKKLFLKVFKAIGAAYRDDADFKV